jgi:tungstate transport system ATP-binding protein
MGNNTLIEVKGLVFERGGKKVIDIPSLAFKRGNTYALMGPNGAGKTTLLHLLNRLEKPTSGTIRYNGIDIFGNNRKGLEIQRKMTLVTQPPFLFDTSVFTNIAFGLKARGFSREEIRKRVLKYLSLVGLGGYEKRRARKLSGGETQRVALARALALEPELLLLDEPTAFIDSATTSFIENLLKSLNKNENFIQPITIIFSTHNAQQANSLANMVINIQAGKIESIIENSRANF